MKQQDVMENLTKRQWYFFALRENDKRPQGKGWQETATTDQTAIQAILNSDLNIGVMTGKQSGIFVLDIDCKNDAGGFESLRELESKHGTLPPTYTVMTPSGGMHYYFKFPEKQEIRNSAGKVGKGIDIRGNGGYVVGCSSTIDGNEYHRADGTPDHVVDAPEWLLKLLNAPKKSTAIKPNSGTVINSIGSQVSNGITQGSRNDSIFRLVCSWMANGYPYETIKQMALIESQKCDPPLEEPEVICCVDSAFGRYKLGNPLQRAVEEINSNHFFAMYKGKAFIVKEMTIEEPLEERLQFMKSHDFKTFMANKKIEIDGKIKSLGDLWITSEDRRGYDRITFRPEGCKNSEYNLWQGFTCEPNKEGDCSLFLEHIKDNIADGNMDLYNYMVAWMANIIQNPAKRAGVALALIGEQGCGKSIFVNQFGKMFGRHYKHISNIKQLAGNFNGHLQDAILVNSDESTWGGDKEYESQLKRMITEDTIVIERKGIDASEVKNYINIIMTSNNDWLFNAAPEERRYCVMYVNNNRKQDRAYFSKLINQLDNGGREKLLAILQEYDLSGIDLTKIPATKALLDHKIESLPPVGKFWYETLKKGYFGNQSTGFEQHQDWNGGSIKCELLFNFYVDFCKTTSIKNYSTSAEFGKKLRRLGPEKVEKSKKSSGNSRVNYYGFPTIEECRTEFENKLGYPILWEEWYPTN